MNGFRLRPGITKCAAVAASMLGIWACALSACGGQDSGNPAAAAATPTATGGKVESAWQNYSGMAIQLISPDAFGTYGPLIEEIAELGAESVLISPAAYMEHARSQAIFIDAMRTPAPDDFKDLLLHARKLGLRTIVMPIVLLKYPRGSEWRGVIEPPDWDDWWMDYRDFIKYFADIAREGQADAFMVGSELVSTEKYTAEWVKTIDTCRAHFRSGKLGYSANWDHYQPIKFWDKLDFVSMTSYYTLADKKNPSVEEIVKKWEPIRRDILSWAKKINKPVVLTEVGWCSQEGAAMAPWNYYQNQHASAAGHEEQRRLYEAFIKAWNGADGLGGVFWWEWAGGAGGPDDYNYTPKGKPAEKLLREWFKSKRRPEESANKQ